MTSAEQAYLFRHALMRDAAYELQLPGERARLHELAFYLIEQAFGGRAPDPPPLDAIDPPKLEPHPTDTVAAELAEHARLGQAGMLADASSGMGVSKALRVLYLRRAAESAQQRFDYGAAFTGFSSLVDLLEGAGRNECTLLAGTMLLLKGRSREAEGRFMSVLDQDCVTDEFRARALLRLFSVYSEMGRTDAAERTALHALSAARRTGNRQLEVSALNELAWCLYQIGRFDESLSMYQEAAELCLKRGDYKTKARIDGNLATLLKETGKAQQAEQLYLQALVLFREHGQRRNEGDLLSTLAALFHDTGRYRDAERAYHEALEVNRETRNHRNVAIVLLNMASLHAQQGRSPVAQHELESAIQLLQELDESYLQGYALRRLASLYNDNGRFTEAERLYQLALTELRRSNGRRELGTALAGLALTYTLTNQVEQARTTFEEALAVLGEVGDRRMWAFAVGNFALLHVRTGQARRATEMYEQALKIHREFNNLLAEGAHTCEYSLALLAVGRLTEAQSAWAAGTQILRDNSDTGELARQTIEMRQACAMAGIPPFDAVE